MAMTRSDENRHDFAFIAGVVIGAISGALVTLALTPMSGADTREKLRSRAEELGPMRERAMEAAAPMRERAMGAAGPVKEKAGTLASTAAGRAQTLASSGKERAAGLAAKAPIGRGSHDANEMDVDDANAMLAGNDPSAHPGGTMTAAALANAGAGDTDSSHLSASGSGGASVMGTTERPPRVHTQDPAKGARSPGTASGTGEAAGSAHAQQPAEGQREPGTESGNGRVSERPVSD